MKSPVSFPTMRCLALAIALLPAIAGAKSGEFTFVVGDVTLVKANGQKSRPVRGTVVDPGDRIDTGADGMAQLTMVDNARLSLRPRTQFVIEQYARDAQGQEGGILNLIKGTLRAFTGAIAQTNRDRFVMKTRVATVGIRGSGNILYACDPEECDKSVTGDATPTGPVTVNHTIEGAHAVTNFPQGVPPGLPPQQGGASTLITGPGQTVMVMAGQAPQYIPTPGFIAESATNMTGGKGSGDAAGSATAAGPSDARVFAPGDVPAPPPVQATGAPVGGTTPAFPTIDASGNLSADPLNLHDVVIASGAPFLGQAVRGDIELVENQLRGYRAYAGTQSGVQPFIEGGVLRDHATLSIDGTNIYLGRWENASLGYFGPGSGTQLPGSIHWITAPSGYPAFLSDVLTGVATYSLVAATSPTNQHNTAGTLGQATINVNFSDRTLGFQATVTMPSAGGVPGGSWHMNADNVPITLNGFYGSTEDRLIIVNPNGISSASNGSLTGSFEGSFVGTGLGAAIVGYGISDMTDDDEALWQHITGVAAFAGTPQDGGAEYREGRVSDPAGTLQDFLRSYGATNRPGDVASGADGSVTAFTAPFSRTGTYSRYTIGSAQVVDQGFDPETGMVWGRWTGGTAQVQGNQGTEALNLQNTSLHYIFAGTQSGPVSLPLTGTATYDVIGHTNPTGPNGAVGTLNAASLDANFTNRTVSASVNIGINGQTWTGVANNMPIYRDQYFSAYSGSPIPGVPNPAPLVISCQPNCGVGATGSFDGFFTGRTGQRAGMMYNLGGNSGAVAFGRRGG